LFVINGGNLKLKEIRELSSADLAKKVVDLKKELDIEKGIAGAKNSGKIKNLRRTIARMLCIKREHELKIRSSPSLSPLPSKAKESNSSESKVQKIEKKTK
jgi:ribosomal protein L29